MKQIFKNCWYWFINLFSNNKFKKPPEKDTGINNLENKEIKVISCTIRYIEEKEN